MKLALVACAAAAAATASACARTTPAVAPEAPAGPDGVSIVPLPEPAGGLLVVVNEAPVHLTFELAGAELGVAEDDPSVWIVDGQIIEVGVVPRAAIDRPARAPGTDDDLLREHQLWESAYLTRTLGADVGAEPHACHTARGAACLLTHYQLPGHARANLQLTTVLADHVVGLSSPLHAGEDASEAAARLTGVLDTMSPSGSWIDPRAEGLRRRVRGHAVAPVARVLPSHD